MQIEFGWALDGAGWADATTSRGVTGQVRMGPRALVQLLQTRLGLTRPTVDQAVRIAQYQRLIEQHLVTVDPAPQGLVGESDSYWPTRSFVVDPWSTARQLLRWRDATVEAGWAPAAAPSPLPARLEALRAVESLAVVGMPGTHGADGRPATLSPSAADDLSELVSQLEELHRGGETWPLGIEALALREDPARLPGLWPRLIELLEAVGVESSRAPGAPEGAGQLEVVQCLDEWSAADVAARFLAAGSPATTGDGHDPLTVLATSDTDVLDRALHRRGLPAVGAVASSTERAHHQVLGLFLDVATAPVDVHQLAALLDLRVLPAREQDGDPIGLVPALARHRLLDALAQEPGVGGPAWRRALQQLQQRADEAAQKHGPDEGSVAAGARTALEAAREIDRLVTDPLPPEGLRPGAIATRLGWLTARLRGVARGEGELLASLTQVSALQDVLGMLDPAVPISRRTLQQIIDTCGGSGPSPRSRPEVAEWAVTTSAAHIRADAGTVLWWGPTGGEAPGPVLWDRSEAEALRAGGAHLIDPEQRTALHVDAALGGLRSAQKVVAILPGRRLETAPDPSGLLAHLEAGQSRGSSDRRTPQSLITDATWSLAGRSLPLRLPALQRIRPPQQPQRRLGAHAAHLLPTRLSFTQAETLIACPHQWVLKHALGIRPASVAALPTGNRMIGTLVHAVVEELVHRRFDENVGGTPLHAPSAEEIGDCFDHLVPQFASELDLPGRAAERADIRQRTVRSLTELFTRTTDAGLRITGTESRFEHPLTLPLTSGERAVAFVGSRDVDARDRSGHPVVIDLKWSRSRTRYGDLYDTGEAIQLASYAWSLEQAEQLSTPADVGYFLLHSGEFVAADPALDPRRRAPMDTRQAWERMLRAMSAALDDIAAGTVTAGCCSILDNGGLDVDASYTERRKATTRAREAARTEGGLVVENYCASGDYAQLCGLAGDWR